MIADLYIAMNMNLNNINDNMDNTADLASTSNNKKQNEKEEANTNNVPDAVVKTTTLSYVAANNNYQAVIAKYCMAWQELKQNPNTCKYFEPTESQVWLIV